MLALSSPAVPADYPPQVTFKMEAERLNSIANTLADLDSRADELRRYL